MILSILLSVIIFAALALFLFRLAGEAGVMLPRGKAVDFLTAYKYGSDDEEKDGKYTLLKIFLYALAFRVIVFILGWAASGIFSEGGMPSFLDYCEKWNLWDAPHYLDIAQYGYSHHLEDGKKERYIPVGIAVRVLFRRSYDRGTVLPHRHSHIPRDTQA